MESFWSEELGLQFFTAKITRNRYGEIMRCLHFDMKRRAHFYRNRYLLKGFSFINTFKLCCFVPQSQADVMSWISLVFSSCSFLFPFFFGVSESKQVEYSSVNKKSFLHYISVYPFYFPKCLLKYVINSRLQVIYQFSFCNLDQIGPFGQETNEHIADHYGDQRQCPLTQGPHSSFV